MLEIGGGRDLLHETLGPKDGREFGAQHLDRDLALVLQVLSEVHGRHAAFAQVAFDLVAVSEGGRESGGDLGHEKSKDTGRLRRPRVSRSRNGLHGTERLVHKHDRANDHAVAVWDI